jgi:hypothetical protein
VQFGKGRWWGDVGTALEARGIVGAGESAWPAADAHRLVHHWKLVTHDQRIHRTGFEASPAASARLLAGGAQEIGGHEVIAGQPPSSDRAYVPAGMLAAVAGVFDAVLRVVDHVHEPALLGQACAAVTTDAQRVTFLAAGQAILPQRGQRYIGAFDDDLFLLSVVGLMDSSVMLPGNPFSGLAGRVGILANVLSLAAHLKQALTPSTAIGVVVILTNVLGVMICTSRSAESPSR